MHSTGTGRVAVIGLGNPLMADDGIGIAVIQALRRERLPDNVELYDGGTSLLDVLPQVEHCDEIILVDCCRAGGRPGAIHVSNVRPDAFSPSALGDSIHDLDAAHAVKLHLLAGGRVGNITLIGVEPEEISPRMELSPSVEKRLPAVVERVRAAIEQAAGVHAGGAR